MSIERMNPEVFRKALNTPFKRAKKSDSPMTNELGRVVTELCERAKAGDTAARNLIVMTILPPISELLKAKASEPGNVAIDD